MAGPVQAGQLVCSTAGRDKGKFYIVYRVVSELMVLVVDGYRRKVENPKKKNIKHLKAYNVWSDEIRQKINSGDKVTDVEVREAVYNMIPADKNFKGDVNF